MQMTGLVNLRPIICIAAASGKQHSPVMESNIIDNRVLVIGGHLFKGPEKIVGRRNQQRGIFDRIPFIAAQGRVRIFFRNTIKPLN